MKDIKIGIKLKELRIAKNIKQKECAQILNIAQNTLSQFENDIRQPSYNILTELAMFYNVSTDYLLGLEDDLGNKIINN